MRRVLLVLFLTLFNPKKHLAAAKDKLCDMLHMQNVMEENFNRGDKHGRQLNAEVIRKFVRKHGIRRNF